jgi:hypothetical protein
VDWPADGYDNEDVYRRLIGLTKADMGNLAGKGVI